MVPRCVNGLRAGRDMLECMEMLESVRLVEALRRLMADSHHITRPVVSLLTGHYKEVVSRVSSEQSAEFDHVLIDVNQVRSACTHMLLVWWT